MNALDEGLLHSKPLKVTSNVYITLSVQAGIYADVMIIAIIYANQFKVG